MAFPTADSFVSKEAFMPLFTKFMRTQLSLIKPLISNLSLQTVRRAQERVGDLMRARQKKKVLIHTHDFEDFSGAWVIPKDERRTGAILYLHGGGYCCGALDYAQGFASTLSTRFGVRVFAPAYRLAPEHPFPSAIDDALTSYQYLLSKGYPASEIALCGESAGGGLCYALCLRLRELDLPQPAAIIAVSPWTDLTLSGNSIKTNADTDPSLTYKTLDFYRSCYAKNYENPLVSPLFADLSDLPPSLIFAGEDELLLDDAVRLDARLKECGCRSTLTIGKDLWHGYLLYHLKECEGDFDAISRFLNKYHSKENKLRWVGLDNAAKIYPAALSKKWSNVYRLSATLTEPIDLAIMQTALDVTARRFPTINARLRRGLFWYYLEQMPHAPEIMSDTYQPLRAMSIYEIRKCAYRVIVHERRVAVEVFHALTDGTGAITFLKTLLAEYLTQRYGLHIPEGNGILGRLDEPRDEELEDSFLKYAGKFPASRKDTTAYRLGGKTEPNRYLHLLCMKLPVRDVLNKAHEYNATLTEFIAAVMIRALINLQRERVPIVARRRPIKVLIPINLRTVFPSKTLRNFAYYTTPGVDPRLGEYTFEEILAAVHHRMGLDINQKVMGSRIATNVKSELSWIVKIMPLPIKNVVMKIIFDLIGECQSCLSISNLGAVRLPSEMQEHLVRFDFILGPQASAPSNVGVISYGDTLYINFIRNVRPSDLELHFYRALREFDLIPEVESNHADAPKIS